MRRENCAVIPRIFQICSSKSTVFDYYIDPQIDSGTVSNTFLVGIYLGTTIYL